MEMKTSQRRYLFSGFYVRLNGVLISKDRKLDLSLICIKYFDFNFNYHVLIYLVPVNNIK